jgi:sigma-B regulation protein RsbU (phosphoserine phosphatase)
VLPGVPLGSFAASTYDEVSFDLAAGDVYVFCSDGVFEATDTRGREFGIERLTNVVLESRKLPARAIVESVFQAVADFRGEMAAKDDMTVVALRITA